MLFGGLVAPRYVADTWEFDGNTWTEHDLRPSRLLGPALYDPDWRRTSKFDATLAKMWGWDGRRWAMRAIANPPSSVGNWTAFAFDSRRKLTVLVFPVGANSQTWECDGARWVRRTSTTTPPVLTHNFLTFDSTRGRVVSFGGGPSGLGRDIWEWDGTDWTRPQVNSQIPAPRFLPAWSYDAARRRCVLFGGVNGGQVYADTWEWGAPAGTPQLAATPGSRPWLGESLSIELTSLPNSVRLPPFGLVGGSRTQWGPLPLPFSLAIIGMPGCDALVSPDLTIPLLNGGGRATWRLPIPGDTGLLGKAFYVQSLQLDPTANRLGLTVSNGGAATIGLK